MIAETGGNSVMKIMYQTLTQRTAGEKMIDQKKQRAPVSQEPIQIPCPQAVNALLLGNAHFRGLEGVIDSLPAVRGVLER